MNNDIIADKDQPIEAVLVKRRQGERNDLVLRDHVVLKNGPRTYKVATHWAVISPGTDQLRHEAVRIEAYKKCKAGWTCDDARSIRLEYIDEVRLLGTFLGAINNASIPNTVTDYLIVPVDRDRRSNDLVRQLLDMISTGDKAKVIAQILSTVSGDLQVLQALVNSAIDNRQASMQVSAALNVARFSQALAQLQQLIKENADESAFQALLTDNPWMFGSEYSELLNRRGWTQNEVQDFALRRTVDGYLEIVEIKTPLECRKPAMAALL